MTRVAGGAGATFWGACGHCKKDPAAVDTRGCSVTQISRMFRNLYFRSTGTVYRAFPLGGGVSPTRPSFAPPLGVLQKVCEVLPLVVAGVITITQKMYPKPTLVLLSWRAGAARFIQPSDRSFTTREQAGTLY